MDTVGELEPSFSWGMFKAKHRKCTINLMLNEAFVPPWCLSQIWSNHISACTQCCVSQHLVSFFICSYVLFIIMCTYTIGNKRKLCEDGTGINGARFLCVTRWVDCRAALQCGDERKKKKKDGTSFIRFTSLKRPGSQLFFGTSERAYSSTTLKCHRRLCSDEAQGYSAAFPQCTCSGQCARYVRWVVPH